MTNLRGFTSTKIVLTNDAKSLSLDSVFFTEECGLYDYIGKSSLLRISLVGIQPVFFPNKDNFLNS